MRGGDNRLSYIQEYVVGLYVSFYNPEFTYEYIFSRCPKLKPKRVRNFLFFYFIYLAS